MKIYRVVECQGDYDDYGEYIRCTTTSEEVADQVMTYLSGKEYELRQKAKRCEDCVYGCGDNKPCENVKLENTYGDEFCANWFSHYDESNFKIGIEYLCESFDEWVNIK